MGFSVIVENFVTVVVEMGRIIGFSVTITVLNREGTSVNCDVPVMGNVVSSWRFVQEQEVLSKVVMISLKIVIDLVDVLVSVVVTFCVNDFVIVLVNDFPRFMSLVVSIFPSLSVVVGFISVSETEPFVAKGVFTIIELTVGGGSFLSSLSLPSVKLVDKVLFRNL